MRMVTVPRNIIKRNEHYRRDFLKNNPGVFGIYFCYLCSKPMTAKTMQVDHIMPITKLGGTNMSYNLAPLCPKCNRKKSNKVDARVPIIYTRKILGSLIIIPFKLLGAVVGVFGKLSWTLKLIVIGAILFYLWSNDWI